MRSTSWSRPSPIGPAATPRLEAAESEALRQGVRDRANDLLDTWSQIAHDYQDKGTALQYNPSEVGAAEALAA